MKTKKSGNLTINPNRCLKYSLALLILLVPSSVCAGVPRWFQQVQKIEPLVTTRGEVERIVGKMPLREVFSKVGMTVEYQLEKATFEITFAHGVCEGYLEKFNVGKDVVLDVDVSLNNPVPFSVLGLDLTSYRKKAIRDIVGKFTYVNLDTGIRFNGTSKSLDNFQLFPNSKMVALHKCE